MRFSQTDSTSSHAGIDLGAVNLKKYHDIVILSFCNIVKGQANSVGNFEIKSKFR